MACTPVQPFYCMHPWHAHRVAWSGGGNSEACRRSWVSRANLQVAATPCLMFSMHSRKLSSRPGCSPTMDGATASTSACSALSARVHMCIHVAFQPCQLPSARRQHGTAAEQHCCKRNCGSTAVRRTAGLSTQLPCLARASATPGRVRIARAQNRVHGRRSVGTSVPSWLINSI
jgi:hypothetical protein